MALPAWIRSGALLQRKCELSGWLAGQQERETEGCGVEPNPAGRWDGCLSSLFFSVRSNLFCFAFKALRSSTTWVGSGALKLLSGVQGGKADRGDGEKGNAPGEARTHGLQIMRLTRCLLRYRGKCFSKKGGPGLILMAGKRWFCALARGQAFMPSEKLSG